LDDKPLKSGRNRRRMEPPTPKPYHITEPFQDRGLWCFWLTAEDTTLEYVRHLNCILHSPANPFQRRIRGRVLFSINPRYDHEEAWLWINELLETESSQIELQEPWEKAITQAFENDTSDSA